MCSCVTPHTVQLKTSAGSAGEAVKVAAGQAECEQGQSTARHKPPHSSRRGFIRHRVTKASSDLRGAAHRTRSDTAGSAVSRTSTPSKLALRLSDTLVLLQEFALG